MGARDKDTEATAAEETEGATKPDGRQARWARHNEKRREQIIAAAVEVIAEGEAGAELHVQQIAERAGVNRTVVYRYFRDRADLDLAIQQAIVAQLSDELLPSVELEGTVPEIVDRIIGTYISWAVAHPALHHVVDHDYGSGALEQALDSIAGEISQVISFAIAAFGKPIEFDEDDLEPLAHGLVGAVFGAVRRWLNRPQKSLTAERLQQVMSQSVWFVIEGHARSFGVILDPDQTIAELVADAIASDDAAADGPATVGP